MEEQFRAVAAAIALGVEAGAVIVVALGSMQALWATLSSLWRPEAPMAARKQIWIGFAMWLMLGLEFELAADVIRSVIAPTWMEIGQLAAIAAIRTFLNFFLSRDIENSDADDREAAAEAKTAG
jgi:uncharacterized membrane protein